MSQQINVNIRMDKTVKEDADVLFNELGFNLTTAVNAFIKQALRERAIPFSIRAAAPNRGLDALGRAIAAVQEQSAASSTDKMTMEEIDAEIAAYRQDKRST